MYTCTIFTRVFCESKIRCTWVERILKINFLETKANVVYKIFKQNRIECWIYLKIWMNVWRCSLWNYLHPGESILENCNYNNRFSIYTCLYCALLYMLRSLANAPEIISWHFLKNNIYYFLFRALRKNGKHLYNGTKTVVEKNIYYNKYIISIW